MKAVHGFNSNGFDLSRQLRGEVSSQEVPSPFSLIMDHMDTKAHGKHVFQQPRDPASHSPNKKQNPLQPQPKTTRAPQEPPTSRPSLDPSQSTSKKHASIRQDTRSIPLVITAAKAKGNLLSMLDVKDMVGRLSEKEQFNGAYESFVQVLAFMEKVLALGNAAEKGGQSVSHKWKALVERLHDAAGSVGARKEVFAALKDSLLKVYEYFQKQPSENDSKLMDKELFVERLTKTVRDALDSVVRPVGKHVLVSDLLQERRADKARSVHVVDKSYEYVLDSKALRDGDDVGFRSGISQAKGLLHQRVNPQYLFEQILQKVSFVQGVRNTEMRIQLEPRFLGHAQIRLNMEQGALSGSIFVENESLKALLEGNMSMLRVSLAQKGIELDRFDVALMSRGQGDGDGDGERRSALGYAEYQSHVERRGHSPEHEVSDEALGYSLFGEINVIA